MMQTESVKRWLSRSVVALAVSAVYLYGYPAAKISYVLVDLFHIAIGIVLTLFLAFYLFRLLPRETLLARLGWILLLAGALLGIVLIKIGTPLRLKPWLYAHIASCVLGALFLATSWLRSKAWLGDGLIRRGLGMAVIAGCLTTQAVNGAVPRGGGDPAAGVGRQSGGRPPLARDRERLLDHLLGDVDVAEETDQGCDNPAGFFTEDPFERCGVDHRHRRLRLRCRLGTGAPRPDPCTLPKLVPPRRARRRGRGQ